MYRTGRKKPAMFRFGKEITKMKKKFLKMVMIVASAALAAFALVSCVGNAAVADTASGEEMRTSADHEITVSSSTVQTDKISAGTFEVFQMSTDDLLSAEDTDAIGDLSGAERVTLGSGKNVEITSGGVYVLSGEASGTSVVVDAGKSETVRLVLDGVSIANTDSPGIYVKSADKVIVTTTDTDNSISVTGSFVSDGETNTDAAIFSKDDLVLNGAGSLEISSTENGVTSKDDLKITGGSLSIECSADALEANDSIVISDGAVTISTDKDGLHAKDDEDDGAGYVAILGGKLDITAGDDGIHATTAVRIDDGTVTINAAEGIEGTQITINGGSIDITASDDGINAARKSSAYTPSVTFNGGETKITMGQGDTDGVDSNADLYINGGTVDVTGQSPFDYDGTASHTGGTIIVNGEETDSITNQFGGGAPGGMQGGPGGIQRGFSGEIPEDFSGEMPEDFPGEMPEGAPGEMPEGGRPGGRH